MPYKITYLNNEKWKVLYLKKKGLKNFKFNLTQIRFKDKNIEVRIFNEFEILSKFGENFFNLGNFMHNFSIG